jgi:hypothetical protein
LPHITGSLPALPTRPGRPGRHPVGDEAPDQDPDQDPDASHRDDVPRPEEYGGGGHGNGTGRLNGHAPAEQACAPDNEPADPPKPLRRPAGDRGQ